LESSIIFVLPVSLHSLERGRMYLIVSEGVTAIIASIMPAPRPANIDLGADSLPYSSGISHHIKE
jgi:hypothetical protein